MTEKEAKFEAGQEELFNVDEYKFQPIKGYPMLNWRGKRPFTATQYYPAQLKEVYGEELNGWRNKIYWGDNLQVMSHLLKEFRGKVDLVYIDPPFDSKADYVKKVQVKKKNYYNDLSSFEAKQYTDIWSNDEYLQYIFIRLILIRELLSDTGIIALHCDYKKGHHLRCLLDEVFGSNNFVNDIVWYYENKPQFGFMKHLPRDHDWIFVYAKSFGDHTINHQQVPVKKIQKQAVVDWDPVLKKRIAKRDNDGNIIYEIRKEKYMGSVWTLPLVHPIAKERTGYPTQKPETVLEQIIKVYSNPNDIVFDPFMGSGTTQAVSLKYGRKFIGADINLGAIQTTTKRLLEDIKKRNLENDGQKRLDLSDDKNNMSINLYKGFEVFNVNNYEIFRNPIEAKELLLEALEIVQLPNSNIFDGEKDGRMIKIMAINRLTTKADLNDLITGFDYKSFEKRKITDSNQPVEKITLICLGHEPDLAATLEKEVLPYEIDVDVVDILLDHQNLQLKRDSKADLLIVNGNLVIDQFYPMNLLQKLSLKKEKVEDWRELVESVMIDWNYDGAVLEPAVVDIPEKYDLVKGKYKIPEDAGTIRVKITDLLSESLEMDVEYA